MHASQTGRSVKFETSFPRVTSQQHHKANDPALSTLHYCHQNLVIPLLNDVINKFKSRFSKMNTFAGQLLGLFLLSSEGERSVHVKIAIELVEIYQVQSSLIKKETSGKENACWNWSQRLVQLAVHMQPKHATPRLIYPYIYI